MSHKTSFGVYVGNSSCCISVNRNGNVDVVANASGERVTPAVVGFHETDIVAGTAAKQGLVRHDKSSIVGALRAIGSTSQENLIFPLNLKCQLLFDGKRPKYSIQNGERSKVVTPEEALKHLFNLLKDIAYSHSNEDTLPLVISLPAWVTESVIPVIHNAANTSGFHLIKTVSQPAAACLAYDLLEDNKTNMNILIFHCGGTSIVASIGVVSSGLLTIKETSYSLKSSGDAITSILVDHFAKEFYMKYKGDPLENRRSKRKLYNVSENCKHVLSTMNAAQVHAESLWEGVDFSTQLSRARFEGLISSILVELLAPIKEVLLRANFKADQIDKVVLTGGTCKIPKLQSLIADTLPGVEILRRIPPDEALAVGAAKETAFHIDKKLKSVQATAPLLSCLSQSIYAKVLEGPGSQCIFTSGTPTHSRTSVSLECPAGGCGLIIYEGSEATDVPKDNQILAQVELNIAENSKAARLQMECLLRSDESLVVRVVEPCSKTSKSFVVDAGRS